MLKMNLSMKISFSAYLQTTANVVILDALLSGSQLKAIHCLLGIQSINYYYLIVQFNRACMFCWNSLLEKIS